MTHAGHVEERLGAYLDAELEAGERAAVESHLHACASCREELAALREVHAALLRAELPEPEARYWGSFAARCNARSSIRIRSPAGSLRPSRTWSRTRRLKIALPEPSMLRRRPSKRPLARCTARPSK